MSDFLLYFPVTFVIFLVLEVCRHDEWKPALKKALSNLAILTAVLAVGGGVMFGLQIWLSG